MPIGVYDHSKTKGANHPNWILREIRTCPCNCGETFEVMVTDRKLFVNRAHYMKWKKGKPPWNTGLTKETDERVVKNAEGRSESQRQLWQDPGYVAMQMRARNVCPNKAEIFLEGFFQDLLPDEYRFVGDGRDRNFIIAGKCPDFVNIQGQKKIIELFGEHVHEPEEEQQRIDLFAQHGYQTLVIWYNELQNLDRVQQKVLEFNYV